MRRLWRPLDVLEVAGFGLIVYGAWRFSPGAAWLVAGVFLVLVANTR